MSSVCPLCEGPRPRMLVSEIQSKVAEFYHVPLIEMTSQRRQREIARPRQVAMYLSKQLTPKSLPNIGRLFGGRDHTTIIHGVRNVERLMRENNLFKDEVSTLEAMLVSSEQDGNGTYPQAEGSKSDFSTFLPLPASA